MHFEDDLEMYVIEVDGIIFAFEDPIDEDKESLKLLAEKYRNNLDYIIDFMLSDLVEIYGEVNTESVKEKLGKPTIYPESGVVDYLEQAFDDIHIFRFEFLDNEFKELQYFQIDG